MEASLRITGDNKAECIEEFETFKYLRWMLDLPYNNWTVFHRNVREGTTIMESDG